MDKRILGSIITILILLGVLWVFAAAGNEISSDSFVISNATASGNYSTTYKWDPTVADFSNATLNFTLVLDFTMGVASRYTYNVSNISIRVPSGYEGDYELGFSHATNFSIAKTGLTGVDKYFGCTVRGNDVIECTNITAALNVSGNATVNIWFDAFGNWTAFAKAEEAMKDWRVTVTTNRTSGTTNYLAGTANIEFGVDDLRPRISSINISDGTYTRTGKSRQFNETKGAILLNNSDLNVTIVVNERNREDIYLFYGVWNGTLTANAGVNSKFVGTNWSEAFSPSGVSQMGPINMSRGSSCKSPECGGYTAESCWYSAVIENTDGVNFSDGTLYTLLFWTNDSFNHEVNFTNDNIGYNFTVDGDDPRATLIMPRITSTFSGRSITFKCETSDGDGVAGLGMITITSPSERETKKTVDNNNYEATFSGTREIGQAGKYKVKCETRDQVGHTYETEEEEFRVLISGGGAGAVAAEAPVAKVDISSIETPSGSISGIEGESETFTIDGVTAHRLTFVEVGVDYAKISIESTPVEFTLNIGESKEVDLDGKIVKVTLSSIVEGKADVSITNVEKYEEKLEEERKIREGIVEAKGYGLWITLLVIVALIVIGYFVLKSRKSKKGEVHFTRQDLGL